MTSRSLLTPWLQRNCKIISCSFNLLKLCMQWIKCDNLAVYHRRSLCRPRQPIWHLFKTLAGPRLGIELVPFICCEAQLQRSIDVAGKVHNITWGVLRAAKNLYGATRYLGGTAVTAPPFFDTAGRTNVLFWHPVPTVTTCDLAGDPLVMALADFTDKEFEEKYAPYLQQRHNWVILTFPLPKGLRRKLFLTVMGVRYRRDRVRSLRKGDGGHLASTNWPPMPPCSRDGWPKGRPLTRNSTLSSRECCRILPQMSQLSSTTR